MRGGIRIEKTLMFRSASEVRLSRVLRFMIPTYLTSLFNTVYTMVDGIFVSAYVGTNALAAINIVYPIVNVLTGIALAFATGGSSIPASGRRTERSGQPYVYDQCAGLYPAWVRGLATRLDQPVCHIDSAGRNTDHDGGLPNLCVLVAHRHAVVIGKELFTYFIRVDGSPTYSFLTALAGGILNIILDYVFVGRMQMGILGASLATILGLCLSFVMGVLYFVVRSGALQLTRHGLSARTGLYCMVNGASEFINQLAIAITTIVFNRTAMVFAGEDGIAAVSIIMYLQFLCIGIYFGFSMGLAPPLSYAYGDHRYDVCRVLERYAHRFLCVAPFIMYAATYLLAPVGVSFFAQRDSVVYTMAVWGMRLYGMGFLFSGVNIFSAIRMMAYGKGYFSGLITFLRSFALLLLFLIVLPRFWGMNGIWLAVPAAEILTLIVALGFLLFFPKTLKQTKAEMNLQSADEN